MTILPRLKYNVITYLFCFGVKRYSKFTRNKYLLRYHAYPTSSLSSVHHTLLFLYDIENALEVSLCSCTKLAYYNCDISTTSIRHIDILLFYAPVCVSPIGGCITNYFSENLFCELIGHYVLLLMLIFSLLPRIEWLTFWRHLSCR